MSAIRLLLRSAITLATVALAVVLVAALWRSYMLAPWTRDGRVLVQVIDVAPEVSGTVTGVPVADNQFVHRGDVLFTIDPSRFRLAIAEAQAQVDSTRQQQQLRQSDVKRRQGLNGIVSAEEQERFANTAAVAGSALAGASAALDVAKLNLARSTLYAPANGYVTHLRLRPGSYATAGQPRIAIIDSDSFWIGGYFEETKIGAIHVGDAARIKLMGYAAPLAGHVESFGRGISDTDDATNAQGLPTVNPILTWVRLAQRLPVRIAIDAARHHARCGDDGLGLHRRRGGAAGHRARPPDQLAAGQVVVPGRSWRRPACLGLAAVLGGCTVGPNYHKPQLLLPPGWTESRVAATQASDAAALRVWWTSFDDPALTRIVDDVIAGNLQLQMARQRLLEARAERTVAGADAYPQVSAGAQGLDSYSSQTLQYPPGNGAYRTYAFGFDASWELDVFGGIRRTTEAADADVGASIEDRRAILVALLSEAASDYVTLRATQYRVGIAERTVGIARRALQLTQTEYDRGLTTSLAVAQARSQMESVQAAAPVLEAQALRLIHALSVLTGRLPGALEAELVVPAPQVPPPPPLAPSLPSEVVANRPDIRRAERRLAASTARIGAAVSQLYPQFSIPLMLMPTTSYFSEVFNSASLVWSYGLSLTQSLYQGGRLRARVDEARAAAEFDLLAYRQTVLTAFREVEDALATLQAKQRRQAALRQAVADSRIASSQAERLYGAGLADFLNVPSAERIEYAAEDQLALSDLARVQQVITLYQSLGGGWQAVRFSCP